MRLKKSTSLKKFRKWMRATKSRLTHRSRRSIGAICAGAVCLVVIGVMLAALLIPGHQTPQQTSTLTQAKRTKAAEFEPVSTEGLTTESAAKRSDRKSSIVTITGCLERADETFRLKDTSGADAPKSRTWKSGFLKKGPATIEVVDDANRLKLPNHVGQRVSVTGALVNREMRVRSLQPVAASCNKNPKA